MGVSVISTTVQAFLLRMALNQSGMTIADINPIATSPSYMEDLLSQEAAAFIAWEPFAAKAEGSGALVFDARLCKGERTVERWMQNKRRYIVFSDHLCAKPRISSIVA